MGEHEENGIGEGERSRRRWPVLVGIAVLVFCCCGAGACYFLYDYFQPELDDIFGVPPAEQVEIPGGEFLTVTATSTPAPTATPQPVGETDPGGLDAAPTATPATSPTATTEPTQVKDEVAFVAFILSEIFHGIGESDIANGLLVLGADPVPVAGAEVTLTMTRPDGTTQTLAGVTDADGRVSIVFDIFVFGDYSIAIDDVVAEGFVYSDTLNIASEFPVPVGSAETQMRPADRVAAFYDGFNQAMAGGDADFLFGALHPAVIERYGEAACVAWLAQVVAEAPRQVEVLGLVDFGVWNFAQDEVQAEIEHAYSVAVLVSLPDGTAQEVEAHVALRDDASVGWFTDCGEPLE